MGKTKANHDTNEDKLSEYIEWTLKNIPQGATLFVASQFAATANRMGIEIPSNVVICRKSRRR